MASQPILGETGSLAANGHGSPAVGKVAAKVGTSVSVDPVTGRLYSKVQALAGYMTLDDGTGAGLRAVHERRQLSRALRRLLEAGEDVALVAAAFQQSLSE